MVLNTAIATRTADVVDSAAKTIVVAMSGGVDSCAAAIMLREAGHRVVGISMQVWDYRRNGGNSVRATCCAPADFDDARRVAEASGFPFYVFDFEDAFHDAVIRPFVDAYLAGRTPNPCLNCNRQVKFYELRQRAKALGADFVATGHYARIDQLQRDESGADLDELGLFTAADEAKDQSYFLYALTQAELRTTLFPVGHLPKPDVRSYLATRGFALSSKPESQDICFVSTSAGQFVEEHADKCSPSAGDIVSIGGKKLGQHRGVHHYTVGQRRGLRISNPEPLYVVEVDAVANRVVVGERGALARESFTVEEVNWISDQAPQREITALTKLRYRHRGVRCLIKPLDNGSAVVSFHDEAGAVSPGQAAVFYSVNARADGARQVFGGGIIAA